MSRVNAETMPTCMPLTSMIAVSPTRPSSAGSWLTSRLPEITGKLTASSSGMIPSGAVVELVVAQRHGVEADGLHEFARRGPAIGGEEEAALVLVAGVEDEEVLAFELGAFHVDGGGDTRHAAEAFAGRVILGRAGRIEAVDRRDTAVQIVDMQDVQGRFGSNRRGQRKPRQDRRRSQDT